MFSFQQPIIPHYVKLETPRAFGLMYTNPCNGARTVSLVKSEKSKQPIFWYHVTSLTILLAYKMLKRSSHMFR